VGFGRTLVAWTARIGILTALALTAPCGGDDGTSSPTPTDAPTTSPTDIASPAATGSPTSGAWRTLAPMPTPRTEVAVAELNGKIYVIGGFEADGSPSAKVEVYDPTTDTWSEHLSLPEPRHHAAAISLNDSLLVIGGFRESFEDPQSTVYQYREEWGQWHKRSPLNTARGGHAATKFSGSPVVVGGVGKDSSGGIASLASTEQMDTGSERWHEVERAFRTPRDHLVAAAVTLASDDQLFDRVHVIGGRSNLEFSRNLDDNESLTDPEDWAPLPTARSGIAAATCCEVLLEQRIYVFGGESPDGTFDTVEAYDPWTDQWQTLPPMPTARHGLGAAVVDGTIYVIGGGPTPGLSVTGANEAFTP